jgi:SAM-dependent methyltransferase
MLDVGCGDGALLDALHARGRDALGLERESSRTDVRDRDVTDFDECAGEWAAVVFWHSLEHLRDPVAALERAGVLLAPRGVLVIAIPNWGSWQARALRTNWFALDIPRHLAHIPARQLLATVSAQGFELERVSYWRAGQVVFGWLHGLVGVLPGELDLYDAIRRPVARSRPLSRVRLAGTLAAAAALAPVALALAMAEAAARAGGTVYVEARRR